MQEYVYKFNYDQDAGVSMDIARNGKAVHHRKKQQVTSNSANMAAWIKLRCVMQQASKFLPQPCHCISVSRSRSEDLHTHTDTYIYLLHHCCHRLLIAIIHS